ncbi:hypothetical protein CDAR_61381, partial [Caerostris darwini]
MEEIGLGLVQENPSLIPRDVPLHRLKGAESKPGDR